MDERKKSKVICLRVEGPVYEGICKIAKSNEWTVAHTARYLVEGFMKVLHCSPFDQEVSE